MPAKSPNDVFVMLLSQLRENADRATKFYDQASQIVEDPDTREALEARVFTSSQMLANIDRCFHLIGEKPAKLTGDLYKVFIDDFRREHAAIESPVGKQLYVLAKASHWTHLVIAEYKILIAAADLTGHFGVGVLLESSLADKLAFVERTQRLVARIVEAKAAARLAA